MAIISLLIPPKCKRGWFRGHPACPTTESDGKKPGLSQLLVGCGVRDVHILPLGLVSTPVTEGVEARGLGGTSSFLPLLPRAGSKGRTGHLESGPGEKQSFKKGLV